MKRLAWFLILSLAVSPAGVEAGTTGKVTGVVKDATSGEPLPGVSIVIVGTRRGAVTDASGTYIILSVEPGTYTLTATLVGYQGETKRDVQVAADFTTTVGFSLKETAIQMGEVTVMAERPPVEPDKTTSKYVATAREIEQVPLVRSTAGLVQLMPGVALDGSARIRGSEISEGAGVQVVYYVDGIKLANNDGKAASPFTGINRTAIQELSVLTGGMEAEYGNAEGGVVNIITKEGGGRLNGYAEYRLTSPGQKHWGRNVYSSAIHRDKILIIDPATGKWTGRTKFDDPTWASETDPRTGRLAHEKSKYTDITGHFVEGNLSGGLGKDLTFFVSGQYSKSPSSIPSTALSTPLNFQNNTSLTWRASSNVKAKLGLIYAYQEGYLDFQEAGPNVGGGALPARSANPPPGLVRSLYNDGRDIFLPLGATYGYTLTKNEMEYLVLTHTLSS
ncbi:carboxypeptidase-like regulatory domain-containing protein [bacterium]|nr:carboxypeptidase-like regulatory domain-containing protein [bacterium]